MGDVKLSKSEVKSYLDKAISQYIPEEDSESFRQLANLKNVSELTLDESNFYNSKPEEKLDPNWVTGYCDAESSFTLSMYKKDKSKPKFNIIPVFKIGVHLKDLKLLNKIQSFFGAGSIYKHDDNSVQLQVYSIKELIDVIIPHFEKYSLLTQKKADFLLFKQIVHIINTKQHLTIEGLNKIASLRASMNWGLSNELKESFPDVVAVQRPLIQNQVIQNPNWVSGFTDGEGCFYVKITKSSDVGVGFRTKLRFQLTQHSKDEPLMKTIIQIFNCGKVITRSTGSHVDFTVNEFSNITVNVIPFFKKYPLQSQKKWDFEDFCRINELMLNKTHLTEQGLEQIRLIKAKMNKGRNIF